MKHFNLLSNFRWLTTVILLVTFSVGNVWGQSTTYTSNVTLTTSGGTNASTCKVSINSTQYDGIKLGTGSATGTMKVSIPAGTTTVYIHAAKWNGETGSLYISEPTGKTVSPTSVTLTADAGVKSSSPFTLNSPTKASTSYFFTLTLTGVSEATTLTLTTSSKRAVVWGINTVAASCSVNPTIGAASLNGSISLSSFPVQTTGWTVGSNCEWSDFGFVWSTSVSTPTLESNGTASSGCTKIQKATSGTSTSTTHSITGSFSTGNSSYVRGYGKNGYASGSYQYTSVLTIVPRSIAFTVNGGSAVSTIYVNSGTAASAPTAPTKTGYTFGGWYQEPTLENAVNWSSNITANKTYYAKWTAKQTTVTLNNQSATTAGATGVTATYDAAVPSIAANLPAKTGYTFGGYYTGTSGGGTKYINADGSSAKNWDITDATKTLYAKWTVKSFTVTWMVNGEEYTPSGSGGTDGSSSVNFDSHVSTLPTAPTPPCGDKFMGWTTTNMGSTLGQSAPGVLFTTAGDAPVINAEGAVTYYAVFADYAD